MNDKVKGALRVGLGPVLKYFGPRFQDISSRLDRIQHDLTSLSRRLDDFERHITTDVQTAVEVLLTSQRSAAILQQRIVELIGSIKGGLQGGDVAVTSGSEEDASSQLGPDGRAQNQLDNGLAEIGDRQAGISDAAHGSGH